MIADNIFKKIDQLSYSKSSLCRQFIAVKKKQLPVLIRQLLINSDKFFNQIIDFNNDFRLRIKALNPVLSFEDSTSLDSLANKMSKVVADYSSYKKLIYKLSKPNRQLKFSWYLLYLNEVKIIQDLTQQEDDILAKIAKNTEKTKTLKVALDDVYNSKVKKAFQYCCGVSKQEIKAVKQDLSLQYGLLNDLNKELTEVKAKHELTNQVKILIDKSCKLKHNKYAKYNVVLDIDQPNHDKEFTNRITEIQFNLKTLEKKYKLAVRIYKFKQNNLDIVKLANNENFKYLQLQQQRYVNKQKLLQRQEYINQIEAKANQQTLTELHNSKKYLHLTARMQAIYNYFIIGEINYLLKFKDLAERVVKPNKSADNKIYYSHLAICLFLEIVYSKYRSLLTSEDKLKYLPVKNLTDQDSITIHYRQCYAAFILKKTRIIVAKNMLK